MTARRIVFFLLCVSTAPVVAGPRDDAAAAMARCAAYPDNRDYLQCLYGAVQPLRASLGLAPALPAQQRLVLQAQPVATPPPATPSAAPAAKAAPQGGGFLGNMFSGDGLRLAAYSFDSTASSPSP